MDSLLTIVCYKDDEIIDGSDGSTTSSAADIIHYSIRKCTDYRGRAHTRGTRHTSVLRDAPSIDISLPPVEETPITPMKVPSTPPVIPLVASSPQSIKATLVDEELVHVANDDQQGQKNDCRRGHC
ncbi:hypothetical protein CK203_059654 [Vitis vinifera]|uniref:Uncharacterized protein n=1 Tax=Vitis vinifera TaxID=29760 RepID=A0A438H1A0_VITVI|nr:hypothetical protein CK203_059654 [Vitis vinifera]